MTKVFMLGSFHFLESKIDFYSKETQQELQSIVEKIAVFNPDKIAIEAASREQKVVDESYSKFSLDDLTDSTKMQTDNLGTIEMYGNTYPITYNNESIQIGYRLGKLLNKDKILAIDDDTMMDMSTLENNKADVDKKIKDLMDDMAKHENDSILDLYKYYNSKEWSYKNQQIYIESNCINWDNNYAGAVCVSKWYERNLKIFANIQNLCKDCDRLFVIYGAGHLQILRDLINSSDNLELVDVYSYL